MISVAVAFVASAGFSERVLLLLPAYAVHFNRPGGGPWQHGGTWALVSWDLAALFCETSGNTMLGLLGSSVGCCACQAAPVMVLIIKKQPEHSFCVSGNVG